MNVHHKDRTIHAAKDFTFASVSSQPQPRQANTLRRAALFLTAVCAILAAVAIGTGVIAP